MEGRIWDALLGQDPLHPVNPVNPLSVPECMYWSSTHTLFADFVKSDTPVKCFFDLFLDLSAKTPAFETFLEDCLPELLSEVGVLAGRSMKKSKKHRALAPAALGDCGDQAPGSWIQDPGSWIQDPGSWILDPES